MAHGIKERTWKGSSALLSPDFNPESLFEVSSVVARCGDVGTELPHTLGCPSLEEPRQERRRTKNASKNREEIDWLFLLFFLTLLQQTRIRI